MVLTDSQLTELHRLCNSRQPAWTLTQWQRVAARLPADVPFAELLARGSRLADRLDARSPGLLSVLWDSLEPEPWQAPDERPARQFWPGTKIRKDDPLPGDRDPATGRTVPARQRARLQRLMDGPAE